MLGIGGTGHYAEALLDVPANDDLGSGFAVGFGDFVYDRIAEDFAVAVADCLTDASLVALGMCGVDVTVTGLKSGQDAVVSGFPCGDGIDAKSELRNYDAVVEGE